jgi:hypothetical protein
MKEYLVNNLGYYGGTSNIGQGMPPPLAPWMPPPLAPWEMSSWMFLLDFGWLFFALLAVDWLAWQYIGLAGSVPHVCYMCGYFWP